MPPAALESSGRMDRPNETKEQSTMGGTFARVLAALLVIGLIVAIGAGVYNAGVSAGLAQTVAAPSGAPVVYYPGPYVWHGMGRGMRFLRDLLLDPRLLPDLWPDAGHLRLGAMGQVAPGLESPATDTAGRGSSADEWHRGAPGRRAAIRRPPAARPIRAGGRRRPPYHAGRWRTSSSWTTSRRSSSSSATTWSARASPSRPPATVTRRCMRAHQERPT